MAKVTRTKGGGYNKLKVALAALKNVEAQVGWFESAKYEDGTPVAYVAAIQEFGCAPKNIPPRPFMRRTIAEREESWRQGAESGAKAILNGAADSLQVMQAIASAARGDIQATIAKVTEPPLKDATVKARERRYATQGRGSSPTKPLIDTGQMIGTITTVVTQK